MARLAARGLMDSRVRMIVVVAVVGVASLAGGGTVARAGALAASAGSHVWGSAAEVPGTAALNRSGQAAVASVSCASAGNCSAGGFYNSSFNYQAFVVSQTRVPQTLVTSRYVRHRRSKPWSTL